MKCHRPYSFFVVLTDFGKSTDQVSEVEINGGSLGPMTHTPYPIPQVHMTTLFTLQLSKGVLSIHVAQYVDGSVIGTVSDGG